MDAQYPRYAAVLTGNDTARIFVFGLGLAIATEELNGKIVRHANAGGWFQARYQRRAGNAHREHAKEVVKRLEQIVREDRITHIILAGEAVVTPLVRELLPPEMAAMTDVMNLDIHATEQDILAATLKTLQGREAKTDAEKVERLMQQYRARGLAVVGRQDTLEALTNGQVEELLISRALGARHPDSSDDTENLLVTKARQTDATVTFIEDPALLEPVGGVGALLRWRS